MLQEIQDFRTVFGHYREIGEKALAQVPDQALNRRLLADGNSVAVIVRHISGNLTSRFTEFLTTDGEKPWRDRDSEFEGKEYSRAEVSDLWQRGWGLLEQELSKLNDADMEKTVLLRGSSISVHNALCLALAHISYHAGQLVLLSRLFCEGEWKWITIPPKKR